MNPGDLVHYQPDLSLPGMAVMLLRYEPPPADRRLRRSPQALIAWDDTGLLEHPDGTRKHGYQWRRYRTVPIRHLGRLTDALRTQLATAHWKGTPLP